MELACSSEDETKKRDVSLTASEGRFPQRGRRKEKYKLSANETSAELSLFSTRRNFSLEMHFPPENQYWACAVAIHFSAWQHWRCRDKVENDPTFSASAIPLK